MLRAIDGVSGADGAKKGIGLWYPTPSEYNPFAFLASLTDGLADEIERRLDRRVQRGASFGSLWGPRRLLALPLPQAATSAPAGRRPLR